MPKYLVTATAWKESEQNAGAFAARTFSFEVTTSEPWNGRNADPVGTLAYHECHRTFGFWPKNTPQIDTVIEMVPSTDRAVLEAIARLSPTPYKLALWRIFNTVNGADQGDVWDHVAPCDILSLIPDDIPVLDDQDELI